VLNNAGDRIFCVRFHWTADETGGFEAVVAAYREIEPVSIGIPPALDLSHAAPVDVRRIPVLLLAGDNAALASNAPRHVEVKAILFAWRRSAVGDARNGPQWFNFIQLLLGRVRELPAQHEPDVIISCPFDEW
jgi:hypothetical protein